MHGAWDLCPPNSVCKVTLYIALVKGVELKALESYTACLQTDPV